MQVMVIGGGIGGLSTALALHAAGIAVRVFESVQTIGAVGVGITGEIVKAGNNVELTHVPCKVRAARAKICEFATRYGKGKTG